MKQKSQGLYIQLFSLHGLIRSNNIEMGFDADTGGQVKYVVELAKALGSQKEIRKIELFTRLISDKKVSSDYSKPIEQISEKVRIVRIPCDGSRYIRKEKLWPYIDEFTDQAIRFIKQQGDIPDVIHTHYADAGYVGLSLASLFGVPFIHTGHSLGHNKRLKLLEQGMSSEAIEKHFNMSHRLQVEEDILKNVDLIITSTSQEIREQYGLYQNKHMTTYLINPPGLDTTKFFPFYEHSPDPEERMHYIEAYQGLLKELNRFLVDFEKPLILSVCRPDKRKNIPGLVQAYGEDKELQNLANLAIFAGIRRDITKMDENEADVLTEMLILMDKYDLYGKMAIPKRHDFTYEIPALYRIAGSKRGVFVNAALTEPFGLSLIEASACGVPIVATDNGGPIDIIKNCNNGILVNVQNTKEISSAIKKILRNKANWEKFSKNGILGVRKHYTWDVHSKKYLSEIKQVHDRVKKETFVFSRGNPLGRRLSHIGKMIVSDIDNTLIGDNKSMNRFFKFLDKHHGQIAFTIASGRSLELVKEIHKSHKIPAPDITIASVGAEIYYGETHSFDRGWARHISYKWDRDKIMEILKGLKFLRLQEPAQQRLFKISYYLDPANPKFIDGIHQKLRSAKCHYNLIYSHERYIDILPFRASKGKAVRYLSYKWNIPLDRIMVCGDSGNDEEMLLGETLGVVVGNYSPELEQIRGRKNIYFSHNNYAASILEGVKHYQFVEDKIQ